MGSFTLLLTGAYNHNTLCNIHLKTGLKHHQKMLQHYTIFKNKANFSVDRNKLYRRKLFEMVKRFT